MRRTILKELGATKLVFVTKWTEWFMMLPALLMTFAFMIQPHMFQLSPHYTVLESWATERTWAMILFVSAFSRIIAIFTNVRGYGAACAILRLLGSALGVYVWGEFTAGFFVSFADMGTALGPVVAYFALTCLEGRGVIAASTDIGMMIQGSRGRT